MTQNIQTTTENRNTSENLNGRPRRLPTRIKAHMMLQDMAFVLKMTERVRNEILADASSDDLVASMK